MFVRMPCRAILALLLCSLFAANGWALRMIGGADPISNPDLPAGSAKLANLPTRISYSDFEGISFEFIYAGDTAQFQAALNAFAAIDAPRLELFVYDGGTTSTFWSQRPVNWKFEVWGSGKSMALYTQRWRGIHPPIPAPPPRLSVFLGDGKPIDWPAIRVPGKVTLIDRRVATSPWSASDFGVVHATVFDMATSRTLPGAILEVGSYDSNRQFQALDWSTGNDAGEVVLKDIPAGKYAVRLRRKGYATREIGYYQNYGRTLGVFDRVGLSPAATLKGRVTDPGGRPIAGVTVGVGNLLGLDGAAYNIQLEVQTDAAGRFTLEPLPRGRTSLSARKKDYQSYYSSSESIPVPGEEVKIVMTSAGMIQGRVLGTDGKPVTRPFIVNIAPRGGNKVGSWGGSMQCQEGGRFEFTGVPPGEYLLTAHPNPRSEGEVSPPKPVTVEAGKTVGLEIIF